MTLKYVILMPNRHPSADGAESAEASRHKTFYNEIFRLRSI